MFFTYKTLRKKSDKSWNIEGAAHETETAAKHRFHRLMDAYAYGANESFDYVACSVESDSGASIVKEIDDRRDAE